MRIIPSRKIQCHVCRSRFVVRSRLIFRPRMVVRLEPDRCPRCDAPIEDAPRLDEGMARGLARIEAGAGPERRAFGTTGRYLRRFTRTEADVDALIALAVALDHAAPPRLAALAASGALAARLGRTGARVKRAYRARAQRHLAIFERRRAAKAKAKANAKARPRPRRSA